MNKILLKSILVVVFGLSLWMCAVRASALSTLVPVVDFSTTFIDLSDIVCGNDLIYPIDTDPSAIALYVLNPDGTQYASPLRVRSTSKIAFGNGYVYVTDTYANPSKVSTYTPNFSLVITPQSLPAAGPTGIAVDSSGDILLTYSGTTPIRKVSGGVASVPGGFASLSSPASIILAPDIITSTSNTYAYIADTGTGNVQVFNASTGSFVKSFSSSIFSSSAHPTAVAVNPNCPQLCVSNGSQLQFLDSSGEALGAPFAGSNIAFSADGLIAYVGSVDGTKISKRCNFDQFKKKPGSTLVLPSIALPQLVEDTLSLASGHILNLGGDLSVGKTAASTPITLELSGGSINFSGSSPTLKMDGGNFTLTGVNYSLPSTVGLSLSGGESFSVSSGNTLSLPAFSVVGTLTKSGSGVLNMTGMMSVGSNTLKISGGSLTGGSLSLSGGTIEDSVLSGGTSIASNISLAASTTNTFKVDTAAETMMLSGVISGAGGVSIPGPGTVAMTRANSYTGLTTIGGPLAVSGSLAGNATVNVGGTLQGTGTVSGTVTNGGTFSSGSGGLGQLTIGGYTQLGSGTLCIPVSGTGWLNVTGNVALGGVLKLMSAGGTLAPGTFPILRATGTISGLFASGTLDTALPTNFNYTYTGPIARTDGFTGQEYSLTVFSGGSGTIQYIVPLSPWEKWVDGVDPSITLSSVNLSTVGRLNRDGADPDTLVIPSSSSLTVSGTTDLAQKTMKLAGGGFSSRSLNINGGTLEDSSTGNPTLSAAIALPSATNTLAVDTATETMTLSGNTSGVGGFTKTGPGSLKLTGSIEHTGTTVVNAGTVVVPSGTVPGSVVLNSGGTLDWLGSLTLSGLTLGGGGMGSTSGALTFDTATVATSIATTLSKDFALSGVVTFNTHYDLILSGKISGTGSLVKTGTNSLTLSQLGTYGGSTTVNAGTLFVQPGTIASPVVLNGVGTLSGVSGSTLFHNLTFNGGSLGSGSFGFDVDATVTTLANATFPSDLTLIGNLTKAGSKTLTVLGAGIDLGAYTLSVGEGAISGPITVSQSTANLVLAGGVVSRLALNGGSLNVLATADLSAKTFSVGGSATITVAGGKSLTLPLFSIDGAGSVLSINGEGAVSVGGTGLTIGAGQKLALSGGGSLSGTIRFGGGTLSLEDGNYNLSGNSLNLSGGDTVNVTNAASTLTLHTFTVAASRAFNIAGAGTVNVPNGITATGNLTVGSLTAHGVKVTGGLIVNTGSLANYGNIAVWIKNNTGGTVTLYGGSTTTGITLNAGSAVKLYTGAVLSNVAFAGGTLEAFGDNTLSGFSNTVSSTIQIDDGATLQVPCFTVGLSSAGVQATGITLTQQGAGTLNALTGFIVPAGNTYSLQEGKIIGQMIANSGTFTSAGATEVWIKNMTGGEINLNSGSTTLGVTLDDGRLVLNPGVTLDSSNPGALLKALSLNGGTLEAAGIGTNDLSLCNFIPAFVAATIQADANATLSLPSFTFAGTSTQPATLTVQGAGVINTGGITVGQYGTLSNTGAVEGGVANAGGTVNLNAGSTLDAVTQNSGITNLSGGALTKLVLGGGVLNALQTTSLADFTSVGTASLSVTNGKTLTVPAFGIGGNGTTLTVDGLGAVKVLDASSGYSLVVGTGNALRLVGSTLSLKNLDIGGGLLELAGGALSATDSLRLSGGTFTLTGDDIDLRTSLHSFDATGGGVINVHDSASTLKLPSFSLAGASSSSAITLKKAGEGTLSLPTSSSLAIGMMSGMPNVFEVEAGSFTGKVSLDGGTFIYNASSSAQPGLTFDSTGVSGEIQTLKNLSLGQDLALTGVLKKSGVGALDVSGYTMTVGANTLQVSGGSITGGSLSLAGGIVEDTAAGGGVSISSDISLDGSNTFTVDTLGETLTLSGGISGSGGFTKTGEGTVALGGAVNYKGATAVTGGTLRYDVNPFYASPYAPLTVESATVRNTVNMTLPQDIVLKGTNGIFYTDASTTMTLSGLVKDNSPAIPGSLIKDGAGSLTLSQPATYVGSTTVKNGMLTVQPGTITTPMILNGGTLSWDQAKTLTLKNVTFSGGNMDAGPGSLKLDAAQVTTTADMPLAKDITLLGNTTFTTAAHKTLTLSGVLSDGNSSAGVTVTGPGRLIMSNDNTYTGGTTVSSGWLHLGCSLQGPVMANSGATFSSDGTINGNVTNNGTVQPSVLQNGVFDPATLKVNGNYTQTGTLAVLIGKYSSGNTSTINTGLLDVEGTVALNPGSTVSFLPAGLGLDHMDPTLEGMTFPIVRSSASIETFFTNGVVDAESLPGFNFRVVGPKARTDNKQGQEIQVILHPSLDASTTTSSVTIIPTIVTQTNGTISSQISKSQEKFDGLDDAMNKSFGGKGDNPIDDSEAFRARTIPVSSTRAGSLFRNTSGQRYQAPQGWDSLFSILDQTGALNLSRDESESGKIDKTFWVAPLYSNGKNKKTTSSGASSDHMQLLLAGMEWQNPETKQLFGVSLGGGFGEAKSSVLRGNKSDHKTIQAALYHSMRWDEIRWDVFANANRMFSHNDRVANASTGYIIKSSNTTDTFGASTEISYKGNLGDLLVVRPYYGLDIWYTVAHGYHEKDNSIYSQAHAKMSGTGFDHYIGASIRKTWMGIGQYSLRLEGDLWYGYILKDSTMTDRITAVENNALIRATPIAGYGKGAFGPSLTFSAMNQENKIKYFISGSATVQDKRTAYQLLLKAAVPLN